MRYRLMVGAGALFVMMGGVSWSADSAKDQEAAKKALQAFNDYIGDWNGNAESKGGKSEIWKEGMAWGWKFNKEGPPSLIVEFKDSKNYGKGEVKYVTDKKKFLLTLTDKEKKEQVFEGEVKRNVLTFTRVDSSNMDKYTLKMNTTNEGSLFNMELAVQTGGRGLDKKLFVVQSKKEGSSISGGKKNECIVSGGVGTRAVSFGGKTYYVCCGGCADAFNENPKKFVDEWEKKNKAK